LDKLFDDMKKDDENTFTLSTVNNKPNKVLGLKKIYQLDYVKSVLELIINANSSLNFSNNANLKQLILKFSNVAFFAKITDLFFIYEWNNMYQKAYESVITLAVNRFSHEAIIKAIFEDLRLPDLLIQNVFDKDFIFDSGRRIFYGNFSFICEMAMIISQAENVILKKILDQNEKWKEFNSSFAKTVIDKFQGGIQFPKENPFENSTESKTATKNDNERSETWIETCFRCRDSLSFMAKKNERNYQTDNDDSTSINASPLKNNFNYQIYDDVPILSVIDNVNPDYFDNNYWSKEVCDFDYEIV